MKRLPSLAPPLAAALALALITSTTLCLPVPAASAKTSGYFPCRQYASAIAHYGAKSQKRYDGLVAEDDLYQAAPFKGQARNSKLIVAEVGKQKNCRSFNYTHLRDFLLKLRDSGLASKKRGYRQNNKEGQLVMQAADGRLRTVALAFTRLKREATRRDITVRNF